MLISDFTREMTTEEIQSRRQVPDSSIAGYSAHYNFVFVHGGREREAHIPAATLDDAWQRFDDKYRLDRKQVKKIWLIRPGRAPKLVYPDDQTSDVAPVEESAIMIPGIGTYERMETVKSRIGDLIGQILEKVKDENYEGALYDLYRNTVLRTYLEAAAEQQKNQKDRR